MRTKIYYGAIALMWLLSGCSKATNNVVKESEIGVATSGNSIYNYVINQHDYLFTYINYGGSLTHSGECRKCKQELDSIVRNAVKESINTNKK